MKLKWSIWLGAALVIVSLGVYSRVQAQIRRERLLATRTLVLQEFSHRLPQNLQRRTGWPGVPITASEVLNMLLELGFEQLEPGLLSLDYMRAIAWQGCGEPRDLPTPMATSSQCEEWVLLLYDSSKLTRHGTYAIIGGSSTILKLADPPAGQERATPEPSWIVWRNDDPTGQPPARAKMGEWIDAFDF